MKYWQFLGGGGQYPHPQRRTLLQHSDTRKTANDETNLRISDAINLFKIPLLDNNGLLTVYGA